METPTQGLSDTPGGLAPYGLFTPGLFTPGSLDAQLQSMGIFGTTPTPMMSLPSRAGAGTVNSGAMPGALSSAYKYYTQQSTVIPSLHRVRNAGLQRPGI
jgi:hypothetical protein